MILWYYDGNKFLERRHLSNISLPIKVAKNMKFRGGFPKNESMQYQYHPVRSTRNRENL